MDPSLRLRAVIALALGASGCFGEKFESERCVSIPADGVCLPAADVKDDIIGPGCGERVVSVDGEAVIKQPNWAGWDTGSEIDDMCCYPVTAQVVEDGCVVGRPMRVEGSLRAASPVARGDWSDGARPDVRGLTGVQRKVLAEAWATTGAGEHASVAAFARLSLELMRFGAPSELVADAHRAAMDEVQHAKAAATRRWRPWCPRGRRRRPATPS